jgi:hypothetical protein
MDRPVPYVPNRLTPAYAASGAHEMRHTRAYGGFPPQVSGALPLLGHVVEFMRKPVELFERGHREVGKLFSLRLAGRTAVVLLGTQHNQFFFSETDKKLSIRTAYQWATACTRPNACTRWRTYWSAEPPKRSNWTAGPSRPAQWSLRRQR